MTELKIATWDYLPDILEMCEKFHQNTPFSGIEEYDESRVADIIISIIENPTDKIAIVLVDEGKAVGMVLGVTSTSIFNYGKVATELAWWVNPEYRGKKSLELMKAYEYWAVNVAKCSVVQMSLLEDENLEGVDRIYKRKGYSPVERAYVKKV